MIRLLWGGRSVALWQFLLVKLHNSFALHSLRAWMAMPGLANTLGIHVKCDGGCRTQCWPTWEGQD